MVRPGVITFAETHMLCQDCWIDIVKSRMLLYLRDSRDLREKRDGSEFHFCVSRLSRTACSSRLFFTEASMDMMGRVGLIEIPILIAPDQKVWMDRMIKEGKIAIPPGGTLEKGSLYSMFVRMLLHNAMEEQKRQEVLDAEDEDDE
jgi:hypothetical protein